MTPRWSRSASQHLAVVDPDREGSESEPFENPGDDGRYLGVVSDRETVTTYDVDVALIELAVSAMLGGLAL